MRFNEIKLVESVQMLTEGYTAGDLAETLWGAAVTAAFEKYPNPANASDVNRIMNNLKSADGAIQYKSSREDGMDSQFTDNLLFNNIISMKDHVKDVVSWPNVRFPKDRVENIVNKVLIDANAQVKTAGLDLKDIFSNGKADSIVIGAQGGADQKGTKVDVAITHTVEGQSETIHIGYSLKTNDVDAELMPVGQNPGVKSPKGKGASVVEFFTELGIKEIEEPLYDAYIELNKQIKDEFLKGNKAQGAILRKQGDVNRIINKNMAKAVDQINSRVISDEQEQKFIDDLTNFLDVHINKREKGLKLLTIGKNEVYTSTLEKFAENADKFTLSAKHMPSGQKMFIYATDVETGKELKVLEIRLKTTGGKPSSSNPDVYRNLRYTLTVSTGPGYNKYAKL
jgi:hypothetical protein